MLILPVHAHAAVDIPTRQLLVGHVASSYATGTYKSVFNAIGAGTSQPGVQPVAGVDSFWMSVSADQCCTVHAFVLGPWTGWWNLNNGELYGTATGGITAQCVSLSFCATPSLIGPLMTFQLTVWGGTGSYAGATGHGVLTGVQTLQDAENLPPAAWTGWLALTP